MKLIVALALTTLTSIANAGGGWISSGGEIFKYDKNPWFVKNTTDVDYCVQVDSSSFSADEQTAKAVVKEALDYWKHEFDQGTRKADPGFAFIATQNFHEQATCTPTTPLRILMGYGNLSQKEIDFLVDPTKYIGISVRTDYSNETLTGQGFVYISSDFGPHAYDANDPQSRHIVKAWEKRQLLMYAVLHELGHVFGIPHMGSGLMSELFLDQLLHKSFFQFYIDHPVQSFITPPLNFQSCMITGTINVGFFGAASDTACLQFEGTELNGIIKWNVKAQKTATDPGTPVGSIQVSRNTTLQMGSTPAVIVQLPPEQKVYSIQERFVNTFMIGPTFREGTANGNFQKTGAPRPYDLQVELRTDSVVMTGLVSGRMMPVMVYKPASLLDLTFPVGPFFTK